MAEYIERGALVREIKTAQETLCSDNDLVWERDKKYYAGLAWACRIVLEIPAADVAPVVRCKDCKRSDIIDCTRYCFHWERNTDDEGFCHEGV